MLLIFTLCSSKISASFRRTWSWRHLYLPCVSADLQPISMCCRFGFGALHKLQFVSEPYHRCTLWGVGSVSYVELIRKPSLSCGIFHKSAHFRALWVTASQFVHLPCCCWLTALTCSTLSSISTISEMTNSFRSFFVALDHLFGGGFNPKPALPCCTQPTTS